MLILPREVLFSSPRQFHKGFTPAPSGSDPKIQAEDAAKAAAEAVAEQAALDIATKAFCRLAVPALNAPLELLEDVIPFISKFNLLFNLAASVSLSLSIQG